MTDSTVQIGNRAVGDGLPVLVIAELSANHGGSLDHAVELVHEAASCGADAIKLQTYTPATMTLPIERPPFVVGPGSPWEGRRLWELYEEAQTPWEWHGRIFDEAAALDMVCFSTPFDVTALAFLEGLDPPAYKVASFELLDLPLIEAIAARGRPVILSTGMASISEIDAAVDTVRRSEAPLVLLRCNSGYPARPAEMDLLTIADMRSRWGAVVGLSDHTLSNVATATAVALGACVIEKHLTLRRKDGGPDSAFSLEPVEFRSLVEQVREVESVLGRVRYGPTPSEVPSLAFRRSLWFVRDLGAGDVIRAEDVASLRPAGGLPPSRIDDVVGCRVTRPVSAGSPVEMGVLEGDQPRSKTW